VRAVEAWGVVSSKRRPNDSICTDAVDRPGDVCGIDKRAEEGGVLLTIEVFETNANTKKRRIPVGTRLL
jgi:hypothetical protein